MSPAAGVPLRPLAVLAALVLAAHWLALRQAPATLSWQPAPARPALALRTIAPPPAAAALPTAQAADAPVPPSRTARAGAAPRRPAAVPEPPMPAPPVLESAPLVAAAVPAPATWRYAATALVQGQPVAGEATLQWVHDGSDYQAQLRIAVPGGPVRLQRSVGVLDAGGLAPRRFSDHTRSEAAAHFDPAQGRIVFSANRPAAALLPGAQDRVSVLVQLAALAAAAPQRFVAGATVAVPTAGTREAAVWTFTVEGDEALALPAGTVQATRLVRAPLGDWAPKLEVWLAPGAAYAPVRLRLTPPNGDWLDLQWSGTDKR